MEQTDGDLTDLLERLGRGDQAAIDQLLVRFLPNVTAYLRLRAGPALLARESTSDLAQSVCRDILEKAGDFRFGGETEFRMWLFTTAKRKLADRHEYWGAQKRAGEPATLDDAVALDAYPSICTPSVHAGAREQLERVEAAIRKLSPDKQQVVMMSRLMGLPHAAIAEQLGRSEGAVRVLLSRALADLAMEL